MPRTSGPTRSTQDLYRLVARLVDFAAGSDENPFTAREASDVVQCLEIYVIETVSKFSAVSRDLSTTTEDVELYYSLATDWNHAQVMCKVL